MAHDPGTDDPRPVRAPGAVETASVRRSPKYTRFLVAGAILGIVAALVLTFVFGSEDASIETGFTYSRAQVFGFVMLVCIPVGVVLGGVVALVLDRIVGRRTRQVTVDRERIRTQD